MKSMVDLSHEFLKPVLHKQAICIDATLGQGKDTDFFLEHHVYQVYGFEIQKEVFEKTKKRLARKDVSLFLAGHENMQEYIQQSVDAIIFNFGYYPNGNHKIQTQDKTSVQAVLQALHLLKIKGRMALVMYPHEAGKKEAQSVEDVLKTQTNIQVHKLENFMTENSPYLLLVEKRR